MSYDINEQVNLSGNYAYVNATYEDTKANVEDIAPHQVFTQLEYKSAEKWNINTQLFYFSERQRVATDTRDASAQASIVNLTIEKKDMLNDLDAVIAVRNLFDSDYREPSDGKIAEDYPMEGFNIYAELKYRF